MSVDATEREEPSKATVDGAVTERDKQIAFVAMLCYIIFSIGVPMLELPHLHGRAMMFFVAGATLLTTLVFMLLQIWLPKALVALRPSVPAAIFMLAGCIAAWFLSNWYVHPYHHLARESNGTLLVLRSASMGLSLTLGLTFLGTILSRIIREANVLLPVAFVAMPIDYIGAMTPTGYTADMVKHHPSVVKAVSVSVPVMHGVAPIGFIGPGDVLFIAFFLAVVQTLKMNRAATFWLMYVFLTATMVIVTVKGYNIAALVPMGLAVLIANFRYFKLQRSEVFASLYAMIIVLVIVVAFYMYSHHHFFGGK